jgi:hypothetical protein
MEKERESQRARERGGGREREPREEGILRLQATSTIEQRDESAVEPELAIEEGEAVEEGVEEVVEEGPECM